MYIHTLQAASFIICLAAKLQIAGTVIIHNILRAGFSNPSNLAKVITFIYSSDLENTSTAGSSLPLVALIFSWDVIFC